MPISLFYCTISRTTLAAFSFLMVLLVVVVCDGYKHSWKLLELTKPQNMRF